VGERCWHAVLCWGECGKGSVIAECMDMFNCLPVADAISRRRRNFLLKFSQSDNILCQICCSVATCVNCASEAFLLTYLQVVL